MMRPLLLAVLLGIPGVAMAQPYGNEWIDYDKQYWKVKLVAPGVLESIWRIDSLTLANAGFPLGSIDAHDIQVFGREKEIPIWVQGEADSVLNTGDFIEFYAENSNGWNDAAHWENPQLQNNKYYNLYNDTICYYLTVAAPGETARRIVPYENTDFNGLPQRPWHMGEWVTVNNAGYKKGEVDQVSAQSSFMGSGEGWVSSLANDVMANGATYYHNPITLNQVYNGAGAPNGMLTTITMGESDPCHSPGQPTHHMQLAFGPSGGQAIVFDSIITAFETVRHSIPIPVNLLQLPCSLSLVAQDFIPPNCTLPAPVCTTAIADIRLEYPRTMNMNNTGTFKMWFPDDAQENDANCIFTNVSGSPVFHIMNDDTVWRVVPTNGGGTTWYARFPANGGGDRSFVYGQHSAFVPFATLISKVTPSGFFTNYTDVELDSACIIVTHPSLLAAAQEYADYREISPRNPMPTLVVDVEELYHQYGGGVMKSGMAIRRFAKHVLDEWTYDPQALFLIGKSVMTPTIGTDHGVRRPPGGQNPTTYQRCLVPTFGSPPSDVCLTIGLTGDARVMTIPVGRLSADKGDDVLDYLGKVQAFEAYDEPEEWMKNILHFRGGSNIGEWALFESIMSPWKDIAEDSLYFSGNVTTFRKNTGNIFDQAAADSVRMFIEDRGVTMMTFLGHASGAGFDINIDQPGGYNWGGKHPLMLGNSCYSGNIHLNYQGGSASASENYVIAGDQGAIGFIASVDVGTTNHLGPYTNQFYRSFCYLNYGESVGHYMKHAIFQTLSQFTSLGNTHNSHTMTLHGDPALVLPSWPRPEFTIANEDIRILPEQVTAELDTFIVQAVVTNIGAGTHLPVVVRMTRDVPNGPQQDNYQVQLNGLLYKDTVEFKVPLVNSEIGLNTFTVMIDMQPDEIPEQYDEAYNNIAEQTTTIISAELLPIWPYKFAITPDAGPPLKASTSDPFAPTASYVFQIDTTDLFNSPAMEMGTVTAPGGVITWQPQFIYTLNNSVDSLVFFWRCSPDSTSDDGYKWKESSFQHIPNRTGWGQAHYFQFKDDNYNNVVYDRPNREFDFFTGQHEIRVTALGNSVGFQNNQNEWFIDLIAQENNGCGGSPAFMVGVVDPATFSAWETGYSNGAFDLGQFNVIGQCRPRPERYFMFKQPVQAEMDSMRIMLQDSVPDGHYVLVYTWKNLKRTVSDTGFGVALYDYLESLGADSIRLCPDTVPYIFICRKGYPATGVEEWGQYQSDFISQTLFCSVDGNQGLMTSGPSMQFLDYDALYWDEKRRNVNDTTTIKLWGRTPNGTEVLLTEQPSPLDSLNALNTIADPALYPELRVGAWLTDYNWPDAEPAQMRRWQILGDPAPECAIDPPLGFFVQADSLFEGQTARVAVAVHNISTYDMDSLLLAAWIVDPNNVRRGIHYHMNAPLPVGGVIMDTISFDTDDIGGGNFIFIEANPVDSTTLVYHQPEQYHFNNYASLRFTIQEDLENPLFDVTFDGIHILDGDIVSAKPEIQMTLDDENMVLLMQQESDTSLFDVFMTPPSGNMYRIHFRDNDGQEVMQFIPTEGAENIVKIFYRPEFTVDGKYTLTVQSKDLSDNSSGDKDYKITFEVVNKPSITNVLNYPNPFTTSTRFVFTVTGTEPPTQMRVQIMTVSGRVVRTISAAELGPMHIGRNITEFAWDGTDEFGDKLARGVYLYRVDSRLNGEAIEHRDSGADTWIEKGMGKMYLMR
jgi:Peptidase family C25/FlgD Ig-like domain